MKINEATLQMWVDELKEAKDGLDRVDGITPETNDTLFDIGNQFDLVIGKMERTIA